jgi:hypothetical protein
VLLLGLVTGCAGSPAPGTTSPPATPSWTSPGASATASSGASSGNPGATPGSARWAPRPGTPWQWQLTTPVDLRVDVPVYDIDGFENSASVVAELHRRDRRVICYVNVGAAERFRPDHGSFPPALLGKGDGWPGERWLDIRRIDVLGPIMAKRFDMCRAKGFDAVEPDLVEAYPERTGFPLTAADQLRYNRYIARLAHDRQLSVGLKNDLGQVGALLGDFDFAVDEQCAQYHECRALLPFVTARKAVLHVEYALPNADFCTETKGLGFSSMRKRLALDAPRWPC